ncbi:MAG: histidine kinase [Balneolaceae bacterium]
MSKETNELTLEHYKKQNQELNERIAELEKLEKRLHNEKEFTDHLFHTLREACLVLDSDLRVKKANTPFYDLFQVREEKTKGKLLYELGNSQWDIPELRKLLEEILPEQKKVSDFEIEHDFETIGQRIMILNAMRIDHMQLILLAMEDVTERKKATEKVKKARDKLEERVEERTRKVLELAKRLTGSEQRERNRISRILHDDLQQLLFAIQMNATLLHQKIESDDSTRHLSEQITEIINLSNESINKTRQLTGDLNPTVLKSAQLTELLNWLVGRFDEIHGFEIDLKATANFSIPDQDLRTVLLQILRECLFNIVKHAETDKAFVEVRNSDDDMIISVMDEGKGFDPDKIRDKESFGLFNIRERLGLFEGALKINSAPGEGTRMMISIPVEQHLITEEDSPV